MNLTYTDIAVNLVGSDLEKNYQSIIDDAAAVGVSQMIIIGSDLSESQHVIDICQQYPNQLYATAGVHPHHASQWQPQSKQQLASLLQHTSVVAVGECGLDYNRDFSPRADQRKAFSEQLQLAVETQLPVYMHERDAHQDFYAILKEFRTDLSNAILHCFTGEQAHMERYLELGLHLGITGWVCDERRGQTLAELVKIMPADKIMIETDSPYLLPRSMRPKPKSSKNKPSYLPYIAQYIADLRGESVEVFANQCQLNTQAFFNI